MKVYYTGKATKRLDAFMADIKGRGAMTLANAIAEEVWEGNSADRLAGRDRYGRQIARLIAPRKGKYKGATGPPLAPFYAGSRVIAKFMAVARRRGGQWRITAGWNGVLSKSGFPFLPVHDLGSRKRNLAKRPIFGVSPQTWANIRAEVKRWKSNPRGYTR